MANQEHGKRLSAAPTADAEQAIEQFQKGMLDTIRETPAGAALAAYERYSVFLPAAAMPVGALHYANGGNKTRA